MAVILNDGDRFCFVLVSENSRSFLIVSMTARRQRVQTDPNYFNYCLQTANPKTLIQDTEDKAKLIKAI